MSENPYESPETACDAQSPLVQPRQRTRLLAPLLQQFTLLVLGLLILDGGVILKHTLVAMLAYWIAVLLVAVRRHHQQARVDQWLIRYGFLVILPAVLLAGHLIGSLRLWV